MIELEVKEKEEEFLKTELNKEIKRLETQIKQQELALANINLAMKGHENLLSQGAANKEQFSKDIN